MILNLADSIKSSTRETTPIRYVEDSEQRYKVFANNLVRKVFGNTSTAERTTIHRRCVRHVWWKGMLYRIVRNRLLLAMQLGERKSPSRSLHDEPGRWRIQATTTLVTDCFWWPEGITNVAK